MEKGNEPHNLQDNFIWHITVWQTLIRIIEKLVFALGVFNLLKHTTAHTTHDRRIWLNWK